MQKIKISERSLKRGKVSWEQSQEDLAQAKANVKTKPEISCLMSVQASINAISSILEANGHFQLPAFSCVEMLDLALQYHEDLEKIRSKGYAVDEAEGLEGIHCVAAVILDDYHYPIAAVTTIAPAFRLPPDRFEDIGQVCMDTAEFIQAKLLK